MKNQKKNTKRNFYYAVFLVIMILLTYLNIYKVDRNVTQIIGYCLMVFGVFIFVFVIFKKNVKNKN